MRLLPTLLGQNDTGSLPTDVKYFTCKKGSSEKPVIPGSAFDRTTVVVEAVHFQMFFFIFTYEVMEFLRNGHEKSWNLLISVGTLS